MIGTVNVRKEAQLLEVNGLDEEVHKHGQARSQRIHSLCACDVSQSTIEKLQSHNV